MRAVRSLYVIKTLQVLSDQNPNLVISCCKSGNYHQFSKKLRYPPHTRFTSSTAINDSSVPEWSAFPKPRPLVDSPSRPTPPVQTLYDPATSEVVTTREHNGTSELDSGSEKAENKSGVEMGSRVYGDIIGSSSVRSGIKKKGKIRSVHVCSNCGFSDGQWWGTCKQCGEVGTMKRFTTESAELKYSGMQVSENAMKSWLQKEASPIKLTDVYNRIDDTSWRLSLPGDFGAEVDRVLGGGLVPGSLVLVGGDPGVGKSTLLLQIAALIAEGIDADAPGRVIYVTGEESVDQIGNRALRLCIKPEGLYLLSSTDIEDILKQAQRLSPKVLIIDSIQTVYLKGVTGSTGSVIQGEKYSSHRLLRSVKNRFGSIDELGVFKMSQSGLQGLLNPSEMYLAEQHSDSDFLAGLAVTVIMDGSRAFLIEVQRINIGGAAKSSPLQARRRCITEALCSAGSSVARHLNGVQASRADMIIQVIIKQAGLKLQDNGIFINVISGVSLAETAGDLAIAAAICSSFLEFPISNGIAFIAEVGLAGELRMVPQVEKRINTLAKLGYKKCIVPKMAVKSLSDPQPGGMQIVGCNNLKEMINSVFRR